MSPGLFQDFMDLYMKFYNFPIISLTKDSQSRVALNYRVPNQSEPESKSYG